MAAGKEHYVGMPQLDPEFMGTQVFWLVVALIVIYFLLAKVAMPRIESILAERHGAIQRDLDQAAELKLRAEEAEKSYQQALAEARSEAQRIAAETKAEIGKELETALAKADTEIAAQSTESEARIAEVRASAVDSIKTVAGDVAADIVKAILPSAADAKAVASAVASKMKG